MAQRILSHGLTQMFTDSKKSKKRPVCIRVDLWLKISFLHLKISPAAKRMINSAMSWSFSYTKAQPEILLVGGFVFFLGYNL